MIRCRCLPSALLPCLAAALVLALGGDTAAAAEPQGNGGSQAPASGASSPVAGLLGAVAATVDQVAGGGQVAPAPPDAGVVPAVSNVLDAGLPGDGQAHATEAVGAVAGGDASRGSSPRRNAPRAARVVGVVAKLAAPVAGGARRSLHAISEGAQRIGSQAPLVGSSTGHVIGAIVSIGEAAIERASATPPIASAEKRMPGSGSIPVSVGDSAEPVGAGLLQAPQGLLGATAARALSQAASCGGCGGLSQVASASGAAAFLAAAALSPAGEVPSAGGAAPRGVGSFGPSSSHAPSEPRSPAPGGVTASAAAAGAACAGLALALLWLASIVAPRLGRRLRGSAQIHLAAPFELILQRPG